MISAHMIWNMVMDVDGLVDDREDGDGTYEGDHK